MNNQHIFYKKAQQWLEDDELPTKEELAELEAAYQDWINKTLSNKPLAWDWELNSTITDADEDLYTDLDPDEDLYTDLDPDWDEYCETGWLY